MRLDHGIVPAVLVCLACAALPLGGCGAGGSLPGEISAYSGKTATIDGKLASRDGEVTDLAGVRLAVLDDSEDATTDTAGGFRLRVRPHERVRIRVEDPRAAGSKDGGDVVEIDPLDAEETCEIEVEIVDGEIVEACVRRDGDKEHDGEWRGAMRLVPPKEAGESEAGGEASITCAEDGCRAVIEVFGLDGPAIYEAVLDHAKEGRESLGLIEVDAEGEGRLVIEHGIEGPLPFGVESLEKLVGTKLLIVDDLGETVLKGVLPGEGARDDDDKGPCEEEDWQLADGKLEAPEGSPEPDAVGWVLLKQKGDGCVLLIEVGELETTEKLTVYVVGPEGDETSLGRFEIGEKGAGRFADDDVCEGWQGQDLLLVDGEGRTVLAGEVPTLDS